MPAPQRALNTCYFYYHDTGLYGVTRLSAASGSWVLLPMRKSSHIVLKREASSFCPNQGKLNNSFGEWSEGRQGVSVIEYWRWYQANQDLLSFLTCNVQKSDALSSTKQPIPHQHHSDRKSPSLKVISPPSLQDHTHSDS